MDIAQYSIKNRTSSWLLLLILLIGGAFALDGLGRLEDPEFTLKQALVITSYPGASAQQVEEEVTHRLESAIQELQYVRHITSISKPGLSQITVEMQDTYRARELKQIWDELRRKVNDSQHQLPPGSNPSQVMDDFADVYGVLLALTGDGYSNRALHDHARYVQRELVSIPGVAKATISGVQQEQVVVEVSRARLANLGISPQRIYELLSTQNTVSNAGQVMLDDDAVRFATSGEFSSVEAMEMLLISNPGAQEQLYLGDVARIYRSPEPIPDHILHFQGQSSVWLGVSFASGVNVVEVGERVQQALDDIEYATPAGLNIDAIYNQPAKVESSVNGFLINLAQAVVIVMLALLLTMGMRSGFIIGFVLLITVLGTFIFMSLFSIELHRVSLGALIIALGMLVDNAIVITEGMLVGVQRGRSKLDAARDVVKQNMWPLLGATVIAVIAFAPIGLSADATGEFAGSMFWVLLISLLLSWFTALTLVPFLGERLLKAPRLSSESSNPRESDADHDDPYRGALYQFYRTLLKFCLRFRGLTLVAMGVLLVTAVISFGAVKQSFFPAANTPLYYVEVWYPQGTDIRATSADIEQAERFLTEHPDVDQVATTIGQGALRFTLTYVVEKAHDNFAQLIVQGRDMDSLQGLMEDTSEYFASHHPQARIKLRRMEIGPPSTAKIEARFSGPDPQHLRQLAHQAKQLLEDDPDVVNVMDDWRERSMVLQPQFNETVARRVGITKADVDELLLANFSGKHVGVYRDGTDLLPIVIRAPSEERLDLDNWQDLQVYSPVLNRYIPLAQVVTDMPLAWEDSLIKRRDRKRTLTVMADPDLFGEHTAADVQRRIQPLIEAIPLPRGYTLEWGGEYEASGNAQAALFTSLPFGYLCMFVITALLFSSARKAAIVWTTVPLSIIGVSMGLLITGQPFSFMALLGLLSLTGMLIKNGVVLLEQIKAEEDSGKSGHVALFDASVSRVRPVSMAAVTTILGMIPLLFDEFFAAMAVTIMFGLGFATLLTLIVVPVMYSLVMRIPQTE
ncbi:efflux RND transporter permease subunit [Aliidiomarina soli]|uniref:MFS transporter n=1 Tax=Aliidiomarina soli TaxID=1928574 RepID=A0A432WC41_9GAMM|nr:efflux RND transporter permease subunit [Aliidiomarina soli]RUO29616.1 MFS transporter [Aliidiomarina soli]